MDPCPATKSSSSQVSLLLSSSSTISSSPPPSGSGSGSDSDSVSVVSACCSLPEQDAAKNGGLLVISKSEEPPSLGDILKLKPRLAKMHRAVSALAQCQLIMGLVCCGLGGLYIIKQGYFWARVSFGIADGFYFMLTGLIGICGSATYRRSLVIAYTVMSLHSTLLFAPALIGFSVVAMLMDQQGCSFQCDLFSSSGDSGSGLCRLLCQDTTEWNWIPNHTGRTMDIGLIVTACFELLLALSSAILCVKGVREAFSLVDAEVLKRAISIRSVAAATDMKPILKPLLSMG